MGKEFFLGQGDAPYTLKDYTGNLFLSLFDQQETFNVLDGCATCLDSDSTAYNFFSGERLMLVKNLNRLSETLQDFERSEIAKLGKLDAGQTAFYEHRMSYQRQIVTNAKDRLVAIERLSELTSQVGIIKVLLLQAWVIDIQLKTNTIELLAEKGKKFTLPPARGLDALGQVLLSLLQDHGEKTSAKQIAKLLSESVNTTSPHPVINDIDDEYVYWVGDKKTSLRSIANRLVRIRKNYF